MKKLVNFFVLFTHYTVAMEMTHHNQNYFTTLLPQELKFYIIGLVLGPEKFNSRATCERVACQKEKQKDLLPIIISELGGSPEIIQSFWNQVWALAENEDIAKDALEHYNHMKTLIPSLMLVNKEFYNYTNKLVLPLCNNIINTLNKTLIPIPIEEEHEILANIKEQIPPLIISSLHHDIYPIFRKYCDTNSPTSHTKAQFLQYTSLCDSCTIAKFLLNDKNVDINMGSEDNQNALWKAVLFNNYNVAKLLLAHGANSNQIDTAGNSLLHHAIFKYYERNKRKNNAKLIELLLDYGADIHKENQRGITPFKLAKGTNTTELLELFKKHNQQKKSCIIS